MNEFTTDNQVLEMMLGAVLLVVFVGLFLEYGKIKGWNKPKSDNQK